jgi:RNA polymerase sigma-70 factor (ECF subfamily)
VSDSQTNPAQDDRTRGDDGESSASPSIDDVRRAFADRSLDEPNLRSEHTRLRRAAQRLLANEHDRDDLVQEVWLEALKRPPKKADKLSAWLRVVAHHVARRVGRREQNRRARERLSAKPERLPSVLDALERESLAVEMQRLIESLDPPYQEVVRLHFLEGYSLQEVSARLSRPDATVRSQLKRALDKLRARDGALPRCPDDRRGRLSALFLWLAAIVRPASSHARWTRLASVVSIVAIATVVTMVLAFRSKPAVPVRAAAFPASDLERPANSTVEDLEDASLSPAENRARMESLVVDGAQALDSGVSSASSDAALSISEFDVRGRTRDVLGATVVRADIWAAPIADPDAARLVAHSDSDGRFTISHLKGESWVWGEELDNGVTWRQLVVPPYTPGEVPRDLTFEPNRGRMRGWVRDSNGRAVAGAEVRATRLYAISPRLSGEGRESMCMSTAPATTDENGRYEIARIHCPDVVLLATAAGHAPAALIVDGRDRAERTIALSAPASIEAFVRWPDGSVAAGVRVELRPASPLPHSVATTDEHGRIRWETVPPGAFSMIGSATKDGELRSFVLRDTAHEKQVIRYEAIALASEWTVRGVARDGDRPLADWIVSLVDESAASSDSSPIVTRTAADGNFGFGGCASASYALRLFADEAPARMPHACTTGVRPGSPPVILAPTAATRPSAFVRGLIAPMETGAAHAVTITARRLEDGVSSETEIARSTGAFALGPLPPGDYELTATHEALGSWNLERVRLEARDDLDLGTLPAPRIGSLLVRWTRPEGSGDGFQFGLERQGLMLVGWSGLVSSRFEFDAVRREIRFPTLLHGEYRLHFVGLTIADRLETIQVVGGEQAQLNLTLCAGSRFEIRVTAPRPLLEQETIVVELRSGAGIRELVRATEYQRALPESIRALRVTIEPGTHQLEVRTSSGLVGSLEVESRLNAPLTLRTLALE